MAVAGARYGAISWRKTLAGWKKCHPLICVREGRGQGHWEKVNFSTSLPSGVHVSDRSLPLVSHHPSDSEFMPYYYDKQPRRSLIQTLSSSTLRSGIQDLEALAFENSLYYFWGVDWGQKVGWFSGAGRELWCVHDPLLSPGWLQRISAAIWNEVQLSKWESRRIRALSTALMKLLWGWQIWESPQAYICRCLTMSETRCWARNIHNLVFTMLLEDRRGVPG